MSHLSLVSIFEEFKNKKSVVKKLARQESKATTVQATVGSKIKLLDKQTFTYSRITLTGPADAHDSAKVSYLSSLGSELLGVASGQHISVDVLGKAIKFQVLSVINTQPLQGR